MLSKPQPDNKLKNKSSDGYEIFSRKILEKTKSMKYISLLTIENTKEFAICLSNMLQLFYVSRFLLYVG